MTEEKNRTNDKAAIRKAIEDFFSAVAKKDIKGMMAYYASDVVVFDCKPPFQTKGAIAWKHTWEASLPYFPDVFHIEMSDLVVHSSGNLGTAHFLFRIAGPEKDHPAMQTWMRATSVLKYQQGRWKAVHEHGSVPFNPINLQALFTLDPQ